MSKGLEALTKLYNRASIQCPIEELGVILDAHKDILKELKVLEIIREKYYGGSEEYKIYLVSRCTNLTEEEYELLKEVLL